MVQPHKCATWFPLGLPSRFLPPSGFVPLLGAFEFWVFLWGPFPSHPIFFKMFWTMMFNTLMPFLGWGMCKFSFFLFPLSNFQCQLISFHLTLIHLFGKLLRPSFLKCLKVPLVHPQKKFHISKGGISLVFAEVITPTMYLTN